MLGHSDKTEEHPQNIKEITKKESRKIEDQQWRGNKEIEVRFRNLKTEIEEDSDKNDAH